MHVVDYWVGVPLCLAVSAVERVRGWLSTSPPRQPERLILIELSEMGSAVLACEAIREAVARLGADNVWFMIFERNRDGVSVLGLIPDGHILVVDDGSFVGFLRTVFRALARCRAERIDTAVDLELFSRATALLTWLSGARIRTGLSAGRNEGLYRGSFFTHPVLYSPHHHMTRTYLTLVRAAFVDGRDAEPLLKEPIAVGGSPLPRFQAPPEAVESIDRALAGRPAASRLVFFNPDPGLLPLRAWPEQHFARLGRLLTDEFPDLVVAVVGVARAGPLAQRILEGLPANRAMNLAGRTRTLAELLELFNRGTALVTIDSGPAHFSGLTGIFRVVLFGPETPRLYQPVGERVAVCHADLACSPCFSAANHRTSPCTDNQCLQQITPEQVFEKLRPTLS